MEVDISWLEAEAAGSAAPSARRPSSRPPVPRPPPLADAALRHPTLEVAPEWLQVDGDADVDASPPAPAHRDAGGPVEGTDRVLRRARPPWQPPTLPPPPTAVARKPTRARAAPIPREDTPSEPPPARRRPAVR